MIGRKSRAIIALTQRKGGVGKTTLSVCIAAEFLRRNKDIELIDTDPQRSACAWAEPGHLGVRVRAINVSDTPVAAWAQAIRLHQAELLIIDTAPNDRAVAASIAVANLVLIPCTPSGLDLDATSETLNIVNAVRARRKDPVTVVLVPNRLDSRTLEGRQIVEALEEFGEIVSPAVRNRSAFVRAFSEGQSVADVARGQAADLEIKALCDLISGLIESD